VVSETVTNPDVSIVMPCLNEADSLPKAVETAFSALQTLLAQGFSGEVVISDNGSSDGSPELAERLGCRVVRARDKGYGSALQAGIAACRGRYVVMGDSDASYDFRESVPMVRKLADGCDICMGSRFQGRILPGAMPWKNRWLGNPVLTGVLNLFFRTGFSDAHCGLRAFTKDAFARMRLTSPGMEFASEMAVKAALTGLKRAEVPVTLYPAATAPRTCAPGVTAGGTSSSCSSTVPSGASSSRPFSRWPSAWAC
jgi:glycosyltransferase involved in cell wall biosynthesis